VACHAIAPGAPLCTAAEVRIHGEIRLGARQPFTALQRLTPLGGFVWAATARLFRLPIVGFDRYTRDSGQMRWRLLNLAPVMRAEGPDITRSAAGRHAGELLMYLPTAALDEAVYWQTVDENRATAALAVGSKRFNVTITVTPSGALAELVLSRWGNPGGGPFAEHSFGASFRDEITFSGVTVPREVIAGWHYGSDRWPEGQFIRYTIDDVGYA
jgi:hypothetical protein